MKKISLALLLLISVISFHSCRKVIGHGPVVTENRTVLQTLLPLISEYLEIMYYTQDSVYKIEIQAQENIIWEIETYVVGNELKIRVNDHVKLRSHEDIRINVSAPSITGLLVSGSGNIKVLQPYTCCQCKTCRQRFRHDVD